MAVGNPASVYDYHILDGSTAADYAPLARPRFRRLFDDMGQGNGFMGVGAAIEGRPGGVAVVQVFPTESAEILDLQVAPDYRGIGVGTDLLAWVEQLLRRRSILSARLVYQTDDGTPAALERILQKRRWSVPTLSRKLFTVGDGVLKAPWMDYKLPDTLQMFPWIHLQAAEREKIEAEPGEWFPWAAYPFIFEEFDRQTSLGLRHEGELAGWSITTRLSREVIHFSRLFVEPALQGTGAAIALLAEGIKRQIQNPAPQLGNFGVAPDNHQMMQFVEKHFGPYYVAQAEEKLSEKVLA